jgi:hypothetical protein
MKYGTMVLALLVVAAQAFTQLLPEKVDTAMVNKIRNEGLNNSRALETIEGLTDYCGSRLTWSPEHKAAADWVSAKLTSWKIENVHQETFKPMGKQWSIKHFDAHILEPKTVPLVGVVKAWSPGTDGEVKGKAVFLDVKADSDFAKYKGKLKKAFVFIVDVRKLGLNFDAFASRTADSTLLKLSNAEASGARRRGGPFDSTSMRRMREDSRIAAQKLKFCLDEGAYVAVDATRGDGGTIMTGAASVPFFPDPANPSQRRINAYDEDAPAIIPQVSIAAEQYNRIVRLLKQGIPVKLEMNVDVAMSDKAVPGINVIGEIPGTDLKDEIVMVGAHLDSWHPGTGAADNGTGVSVAMEAMRILSSLGVKPRRTIRIGLWSGEEQGLFGSKAYVNEHLGERETNDRFQGVGPVKPKPDYEKFDVYFNDDNGSGKFRGIYLQGNEAARGIFRPWLTPFADLGASTITASNTGGTDHLSFDAIMLPGFQFIQDPLEYGRTYHTNFDVFERVSEDDIKQSSVIMASFAYLAAMRDQKIPRKPMPEPAKP